jgi:hypothetical protein
MLKNFPLVVVLIGMVFTLLAVGQASAQSKGDAGPTNEVLFEQCVAYERLRLKPPSELSGVKADPISALSCAQFMAGASRIHNIKTDAKCKHSGRTLDQVISDYLAFTRKGSFLNQPQDMTVFMFLEACYCGADPPTQHFCPVVAK